MSNPDATDQLPPADGQRAGCERYADLYRDVFGRADQARSFALYLRGLLQGTHRRNIGAIADYLRADDPTAADLAQSLHHFVTRSPWDAGRLLVRYRALVRDRLGDDRGTLVVHDAVFPKNGRHSVGVQRQFARPLGRKVNCQVAVVVSHVGEAGYFPLACRLYLPASWRRALPAGGPPGPVAKADIALELLDELRAEGWPVDRVAADDGYGGSAEFRDGLAARSLPPPAADDRPAAVAQARLEWIKGRLGLDHFEGRTWLGWHHHVSLVFAAYAFLAARPPADDQPPFPARPPADWAI